MSSSMHMHGRWSAHVHAPRPVDGSTGVPPRRRSWWWRAAPDLSARESATNGVAGSEVGDGALQVRPRPQPPQERTQRGPQGAQLLVECVDRRHERARHLRAAGHDVVDDRLHLARRHRRGRRQQSRHSRGARGPLRRPGRCRRGSTPAVRCRTRPASGATGQRRQAGRPPTSINAAGALSPRPTSQPEVPQRTVPLRPRHHRRGEGRRRDPVRGAGQGHAHRAVRVPRRRRHPDLETLYIKFKIRDADVFERALGYIREYS